LYFNFGRYLLISSSRPGGLPPNLQGIWAEEIHTPWNGDWHLGCERGDELLAGGSLQSFGSDAAAVRADRVVAGTGAKTAHDYYNARGWVAHVITNPWGFTSPGESASWGAFAGGSGWLCQHLWDHWLFTHDTEISCNGLIPS
jgi:alpha-L-fucosidase 2